MTTEKMVSGINRLAAHSLAPVEANGPLGTLTAGRMQIEPGGAGGDVQIHFTDGVKLIYQPPKKEGSE
jgi:lipopolysaccharide export system protein LptC